MVQSQHGTRAFELTARLRWLGAALGTQRRELLVLLIAFVQGLIYLVVVPPWQHYDEPTHFEYAWLIANRGTLPRPGDQDVALRQDVADSMLVANFYSSATPPNLVHAQQNVEIGVSELTHPPLYYLLVSLPLRLARYLDVTTQLFVARSVSVLLFVLTIAFTLGIMRDLAPSNTSLRMSVPVALLLLPPFADIMTAVNNDVGAIAAFTLFVWCGVRLIVHGPSWLRIVAGIVVAVLCVLTKNTASVAVVLLPLALICAVWARNGWRRRWLLLGGVASVLVLSLLTLTGGDAAAWYRETYDAEHSLPTRGHVAEAPLGTDVIQLDSATTAVNASVLNPLLPTTVQQIRGKVVTAGAWLWATAPIPETALSLNYSKPLGPLQSFGSISTDVDTTPSWVTWTAVVPADAEHIQYRLTVAPTLGQQRIRVYMDGAVLAVGKFDGAAPPVFDRSTGESGNWSGIRFVNLLRNGSATAQWPRLQGWLDQALTRYIHRSPRLVLTSLIDIQRTGPTLFLELPQAILFSFFGKFAWGHVSFAAWPWLVVFESITGIAVVGCSIWLATRFRRLALARQMALCFIIITGGVVWSNVVLRELPMLDGVTGIAVARYGFPAGFVPVLSLIGGWWAIVPNRWRDGVVFTMLTGSAALNALALWTIWRFYST